MVSTGRCIRSIFTSPFNKCAFPRRRSKRVLVMVASVVILCFVTSQFQFFHFLTLQDFVDENGSLGADFAAMTAGERYIVNTTFCKIPKMNLWTKAVTQMHLKCIKVHNVDPKCSEKHPPHKRWMFKRGTDLVVNKTSILEAGYSWEALHCCYRAINSVKMEKYIANYNNYVENAVQYSNSCQTIDSIATSIPHSYIRAYCSSTSVVSMNEVVYRQFFHFAQLDKTSENKVNFWRNAKQNIIVPPSVQVLLVDSNSRLNVRRRMIQTVKVLEKAGAVEFLGFNKVGENTYPNSMAYLTGLESSSSLCQQNTNESLHSCPWIWKDFSRAGYLTGNIEDFPLSPVYQMGLLDKSTDFYYRPITLAWMRQVIDKAIYLVKARWHLQCVGPYQTDEVILDYALDALNRSGKAPVFMHTLLSGYSHGCKEGARFNDKAVSSYIRNIIQDYPNTIFFFLSDHGDRWGDFRETKQGWFEDKLPPLWVYLPSALRFKFPEWVHALHINSKRLTTHFDLYHTLIHILQSYNLLNSSSSTRWKHQSLFKPVPENRTCLDVNIPNSFCSCVEPQDLSLENLNSSMWALLNDATKTVTAYLRDALPKQCATFRAKKIVSARLLQYLSRVVYVVTFYADPGNFLFEGTLTLPDTYSSTSVQKFSLGGLEDILRVNAMSGRTDCVNRFYEVYCYCN